jgi:hypothetical protein
MTVIPESPNLLVDLRCWRHQYWEEREGTWKGKRLEQFIENKPV